MTKSFNSDANNGGDPVVVLAADSKFAMPLATTVRSALENLSAGVKLRLFVLDGGIRDVVKQRILRSWPEGRYEIEWVRVDDSALGAPPVTGYGSIACYFRILIPRLLPSDIRRVIYLDSDLLICADLARLWAESFRGNLCLAVQDVTAPYIDSSQAIGNYAERGPHIACPQPIRNYRELGLDPAAEYFNSGVMVMDIDGWRREDISSQLIDCLAENREYVHAWDQYALNVVLAGRWGGLDRRWNQGWHIYRFPNWELSPYDREVFEQQRDDPYIVHFTTHRKPWRASCYHPLRQKYLECLQRTDWAGWRDSRLELTVEAIKSLERRFRHGRRWLKDQVRTYWQPGREQPSCNPIDRCAANGP